jgi:hypothetical protein
MTTAVCIVSRRKIKQEVLAALEIKLLTFWTSERQALHVVRLLVHIEANKGFVTLAIPEADLVRSHKPASASPTAWG